jgi:hypothetical protein
MQNGTTTQSRNRINTINIFIICLLFASGTVYTYLDSASHKSEIVSGVMAVRDTTERLGSALPLPAGSIEAAAPELSYSSNTNTIEAYEAGIGMYPLLIIIVAVVVGWVMMSSLGMVARC